MRGTKLFLVPFSAALLASPMVAQTQTSEANRVDMFANADIKTLMQRIETTADRFEDRFEAALDKSSLNGAGIEDQLNRWADFLEDEVDNMAEDFNERDTNEFVDHFENAMIVATGINRAMLRREFSPLAEAEWRTLRQDLNQIAMQLRRPVLPNITVAVLTPATPEMMRKVEVKQVMEELEASTDRFERKLRGALNASTLTGTRRQTLFNNWADVLEDVSDDMLEEYKENDAKEFA